jgi:hypothetical protein
MLLLKSLRKNSVKICIIDASFCCSSKINRCLLNRGGGLFLLKEFCISSKRLSNLLETYIIKEVRTIILLKVRVFLNGNFCRTIIN